MQWWTPKLASRTIYTLYFLYLIFLYLPYLSWLHNHLFIVQISSYVIQHLIALYGVDSTIRYHWRVGCELVGIQYVISDHSYPCCVVFEHMIFLILSNLSFSWLLAFLDIHAPSLCCLISNYTWFHLIILPSWKIPFTVGLTLVGWPPQTFLARGGVGTMTIGRGSRSLSLSICVCTYLLCLWILLHV